MEGAIIAILSAGLAFGSAQYHNILIKRRERMVNHLNGLVKLERRFNEYMRVAASNEFHARNMLNAFNRIAVGERRVYWGSFEQFEISLESLSDLLTISIVNECFYLYQKMIKLNHDMQTIASSYDLTKISLIQGNIDNNQYMITCSELSEGLTLIRNALSFIENRIVDIVVMVRSQLKVDSPDSDWGLYKKPVSGRVGQPLVSKTREAVMMEIEEIKRRSLDDRSGSQE